VTKLKRSSARSFSNPPELLQTPIGQRMADQRPQRRGWNGVHVGADHGGLLQRGAEGCCPGCRQLLELGHVGGVDEEFHRRLAAICNGWITAIGTRRLPEISDHNLTRPCATADRREPRF
jgi:hypothetical protein